MLPTTETVSNSDLEMELWRMSLSCKLSLMLMDSAWPPANPCTRRVSQAVRACVGIPNLNCHSPPSNAEADGETTGEDLSTSESA